MFYCELTKIQRDILDVIKVAIEVNGYAPSVREICNKVGLKSTSTVHTHMKTLEKLGFIRKEPTKPRAIAVVSEYDLATPLDKYFRNESKLEILSKKDKEFLSNQLNSSYIKIYINRGDSMKSCGIDNNDYVIVNSHKMPNDGDIILATVNDEYLTAKKIYKHDNMIKLTSNDNNLEFSIHDPKNVNILGTVTGCIKNFSNK